MRSLRILDLTNSILTQLNGSEVFSGLENLEDLDMSYNSLTRLEEGTFSNLKKLKNLRLDFNLITSISKNLFKGLGSLTLLSLKENSLTALQNLTFWFLNSVNELDLNDNKLIKIEENVFVGINESLTHLGLSNNRLQFIKETHFNTLTRLLNLDLSNNQISSIEEKSFSALENLEKLALSRNSIFHFDQALFINQARLKTLDLSSNMIIKVTESMFKNLKSLEEFYLNDNSINVLSRMLFIDVWNLVILDLSNNFITDIDMLCFTNLSKLEKLYLNKVKQTLTIISSDKILFPSLRVLGLQSAPVKLSMQFELTDLESLDFNFAVLNNTIIQRIPVLTINSLSLKGVLFDRSLDILLGGFGYNLNEIDLSDNSLSSDFQKSILNSAYNLHKLALSNCGCVERLNLSIYTNLSFLDLSYNQIADYSDDLFNNNAHIKQLNLSHNNITTVKIKTFWPLFFLNVLDLSFNLISIIEANALENPSNLRKLDLSHNQIKQLNQIMFGLNEMTSLIQIDISFNRELTTVDLNIQTHLFDFINFGVCSLRDFPTQGFSSVPKIGSLILNKNKIVTVKRIYFTKVDAIKQLYLSENLISTIEDRVFNSSKQLLELDLSMNNISSLNNFTLVGLLSLQKLNLSSNRIQILQNGVFNDLVRIESLDLSSNMIRSIEKCTFFYTKHLRYLYIHQNPSLREFFIRGMIEKCERLKYIYMSPDVLFSMSIYLNVKDDLKAGYIKQVLDMKYFSPVNIVTNYGGVENKSGEINYTAEQCVYILFLLKNKVQFNMIDESDVNRYISDCAQTIMSAYLHISN
jgi:Leucine-rich repeat (LRR) protein